MIDRTERTGFGVALLGHLLLFGALSVGLAMHQPRLNLPQDAMDVELVGPIGLRSSLPNPATEPPAESQAPEQGKPAEAITPAPDAAKSPPVPQPSAVPPPRPVPEKRTPLSSDFLKDIQSRAAKEKATGKRLGADFLKGITAEATGGKGSAPRAAITGPQMAGLAAAIAAQVRPCYNVPTGGSEASLIVTVLRLRFARDGSVSGAPTVVDHSGVTSANQAYVRQMDDAARRAVLRCAPLKLPANLYEGGWEDIEFVFNPRTME
jgi:hypothetical protein